MAARGLAIRADVATATELRRLAKKEPGRRTAQRMLAIANALDGMSRAEAARAAGIERQALRDAVVRFNAEGLAGLIDRPHGRRPERLSEAEQAALINHILRGPDPDKGEPCAWTLPDLCRFVEARFDKRMCPHPASCAASGCPNKKPGPCTRSEMPRRLRRSQKGAPRCREGGRRGSCGQADRALVHGRAPRGPEGADHAPRWSVKGQRPPGLSDKRFESAYIFAAVRPSTGEDFALVLPRVLAEAMSTFLAEFARTIPEGMHAVMVLDQAGWHDARALRVPESVTLVPLPAYSPEMNPVENMYRGNL